MNVVMCWVKYSINDEFNAMPKQIFTFELSMNFKKTVTKNPNLNQYYRKSTSQPVNQIWQPFFHFIFMKHQDKCFLSLPKTINAHVRLQFRLNSLNKTKKHSFHLSIQIMNTAEHRNTIL